MFQPHRAGMAAQRGDQGVRHVLIVLAGVQDAVRVPHADRAVRQAARYQPELRTCKRNT